MAEKSSPIRIPILVPLLWFCVFGYVWRSASPCEAGLCARFVVQASEQGSSLGAPPPTIKTSPPPHELAACVVAMRGDDDEDDDPQPAVRRELEKAQRGRQTHRPNGCGDFGSASLLLLPPQVLADVDGASGGRHCAQAWPHGRGSQGPPEWPENTHRRQLPPTHQAAQV